MERQEERSMPRPGWSARDIPDLAGKTAIVTGANSGIGRETARELARAGARVVVACRSLERASAARDDLIAGLPNANIELHSLDLASLESIRSFSRAMNDQLPRLDILCNNAGIMMVPYAQTKDGFELQLGTNHLGHFALTAQLMDLLLSAPAARITTVSSTMHKLGRIDFEDLQSENAYDRNRAYGQSKLANLLFTFELERRLRAAGASAIANASHPGYTRTNLQEGTAFKLLNPLIAQDPPDGALPSLFAATSQDAQGGEYYGPSHMFEMWGAPARVSASKRAQNADVAARLWEVSEQLTGARSPV
jgi:NAD(P)-dependent dehydrogenase (short-subunit alcohol dehydrogenase family)